MTWSDVPLSCGHMKRIFTGGVGLEVKPFEPAYCMVCEVVTCTTEPELFEAISGEMETERR